MKDAPQNIISLPASIVAENMRFKIYPAFPAVRPNRRSNLLWVVVLPRVVSDRGLVSIVLCLFLLCSGGRIRLGG